jgi:hypothetical protein
MLNVNVGDEVFVAGFYHAQEVDTIERVTRLTQLRFVTNTGFAYSRKTGNGIRPRHGVWAVELTPEYRQNYEHRQFNKARLERIARMRARLADAGRWVWNISEESFAAAELAIERLWHDYEPGSLAAWEQSRKEAANGK